jgi:hypothetical protein
MQKIGRLPFTCQPVATAPFRHGHNIGGFQVGQSVGTLFHNLIQGLQQFRCAHRPHHPVVIRIAALGRNQQGWPQRAWAQIRQGHHSLFVVRVDQKEVGILEIIEGQGEIAVTPISVLGENFLDDARFVGLEPDQADGKRKSGFRHRAIL